MPSIRCWFAPTIAIKLDNNKFQLTTPDDSDNDGETFHNSPLKVITATVVVPYNVAETGGYFSVVAIPETVKAFDNANRPVKWSLKAEKDECNDVNGKAKFQAIIHGFFHVDTSKIDIDTQILDCELSYNLRNELLES